MKKGLFRAFFWGALAVASTSTFVSCKDYDDDIAANKEAIEGVSQALKTQVDQLNAALNAAKAEAEAAHAAYATKTELANKADKSDLDAYKAACDAAIAALQAEVNAKATVAQLESVIADLQALQNTVSVNQAKLQEVSAKIDAIDESLNTLTTDIASLKEWKATVEGQVSSLNADLASQTQALKDLKAWIEEMLASGEIASDEYVAGKLAEMSATIDAVNAELADIKEKLAKAQTAEQVKAIAQSIADEIDAKLGAEINNLNVLVNRVLKSISLVPQLFVGGIEAIEFTSLRYNAIVPGTSGLAANGRSNYVPNDIILIDNGTTEAYYRLNPSIVERTSIDEANIEFLAATAQVRAATVTSPVEFNGIPQDGWNYGGQKGLVKVNLRKTAAFVKKSLNDDGTGKKYIVALKVPRLADEAKGVEAADIVSENSLLVETEKTPRIARLDDRLAWNVTETLPSKGGNANVHHYTDSVTMYNQDVDANQLVYAEVNYNETYPVLDHVTGCFGEHNQITKAELKSYGLTFRFHVAAKAYTKDADHNTNQQDFAVVDEFTGVVSSKLPDGTTNNRACVGKEPIICIQLVDTVNNKLVDERYTKIKWTEEYKKPVDLGDYTPDATTLKPCATNDAPGVTWDWIINNAYAKAEVNGLSQTTFKEVYLTKAPTFGTVTMEWEDGSAASNRTDLLSPSANPVSPNVQNTTNQQGDAIVIGWSLEPQEIANIYPHQSKTFKCVITFHSILPTEYPDLTMTYVWTINLPALPSVNGYYDNYWFTQYELHDVMPVQYNTAAYEEIISGAVVPQGGTLETYANANGKYASWTNHKGAEGGYCVYYNNLMNAFTYEQANRGFIVKGLPDCGTWDMQFTKAGKDAVDPSVEYTQFKGAKQYGPLLGNKLSPSFDRYSWPLAAAYRLYDDISAVAPNQALQLVWESSHQEWDGWVAAKSATLYADHNNEANWALINELASTNEADNRTPVRTHNKKVHMGVWGTLNDWNIIPVKHYDICLVAPIRIDAKLEGAFEDGWVSGTAVSCDKAFTMTDFRGYEVAKAAPTVANPSEWAKYRHYLYKYYEVGDPVWNLNEVKYGFKYVGGSVKADDAIGYEDAMTSAQVSNYTNGNIKLSIEMVNNKLVFKNNGGSNVEEEVNVFIPVSVTYGFGKLTKYVVVRLYPRGTAPSDLLEPAE